VIDQSQPTGSGNSFAGNAAQWGTDAQGGFASIPNRLRITVAPNSIQVDQSGTVAISPDRDLTNPLPLSGSRWLDDAGQHFGAAA
jgi:hypothetical protein